MEHWSRSAVLPTDDRSPFRPRREEHGDGAVIECGLPVANPSVGPGGIETGPGRLESRQGDDGLRLFAYRSRAAISVAACTILPCVGRMRTARSSTQHQGGGGEDQGHAD